MTTPNTEERRVTRAAYPKAILGSTAMGGDDGPLDFGAEWDDQEDGPAELMEATWLLGDVLRSIVDPSRRLLWAFVKQGNDVRPVCYSEDKVIWLDRGEDDEIQG